MRVGVLGEGGSAGGGWVCWGRVGVLGEGGSAG